MNDKLLDQERIINDYKNKINGLDKKIIEMKISQKYYNNNNIMQQNGNIHKNSPKININMNNNMNNNIGYMNNNQNNNASLIKPKMVIIRIIINLVLIS